jgi:hypothetical protein
VLPLPKKIEKTLKRKRSVTPELANGTPDAKRTKTNGMSPCKSPTKRQILDTEGVVIIDEDEDLESGVINIE